MTNKTLFAALAAAFLFLILAAPASAQTFDPDPDDAGAAQTAAARYQLSMWGLSAPPVGWHCWQTIPDVAGPTWTYCEPDAALLEQQEREQQEWLDRLEERTRHVRERYGLLRSRGRR